MCARPLSDKRRIRLSLGCIEKEDIQTVATDQCSFTLDQKALGRDDFTKIPGGLPGVQTRGTLLIPTVSVPERSRKPDVQILCENPAKLYGYIRKKA